ncbi:MAG: cell wall hydrolase [Deltaproteobacteria bacterium]|nr:cell wall hydrolase [Deltaproteobacteria bacterium]
MKPLSLIAACTLLLTNCAWGLYELAKEIEEAIEEDEPEQLPSTAPTIEATALYRIALGGVAPGRDELIITAADGALRNLAEQTLAFTIEDPKVVGLLPRPTFSAFADGSGALIVPQRAGTTAIRYALDGVEQSDTFGVTIPPQSLIQILIGEARGQLKKEATVTDGAVQLSGISPTGDAVAAVIRNRVAMINADHDPSLFAADPLNYYLDPPASSFTEVIEATQNGTYQFSPVDPTDASHAVYTDAEARSFLATTHQFAYDQAVLTAASIFDGRTTDPTGGAFAFRSPTADQWSCLAQALQNRPADIPPACGPGDSNFPALAPVQILIHPNVAKYSDGRPTFVFYRQRPPGTSPVTNSP